jgi:hypothetical protein
MTTILYPGMRRPRDPDVNAQVARRFGSAAKPDLPIVPRPLWEAHLLFQEPKLPEGLGLLEDEEDEDDAGE